MGTFPCICTLFVTSALQNPEPKSTQYLNAGQVGYIVVGMRSTSESKVGDTLFAANHEVVPFPGFKPARPMVRVVLQLVGGSL